MKNLKKLFCCILMICLLSGISYSQNAFGGKLGLQFATWGGDEDDIGDDLEYNLGYQVGAIFQFGITEVLSIQSEFMYIQKGAKSTYEDSFGAQNTEVEDKVIFNYLEIPVLAKININKGEGTQFFILAGPSFGYALSGKQKSKETVNGNTETSTEDFEFDENDGFVRFDISAAAGAGLGIPAGPGHLVFEVRYLLGLSNLVEDFDDLRITNKGVGITAGFVAPLVSQ